MTRTASTQPQQLDKQPDLVFGEGLSELIAATNNELILAKGHQLALIDADGSIVQRGFYVEKAVYIAVSTQVVKSFCSRFKGFSDADFK